MPVHRLDLCHDVLMPICLNPPIVIVPSFVSTYTRPVTYDIFTHTR